MSTNIRRNLLATITPQTTPPLRLVLATPLERITTTASGVIATLVGSGGVPGYAYSITAGALPSGTTLQTNGSILVTGALTIGDYRFTAQVQDSALTAFVHTFILRIVSRLTISPRNAYCTDTEQYAAYTYSFVARGATGTMSWALTSGSLPAGLSLSGAGDITGTTTTSSPPYAQSYFVVTGTDSGSGDTIVIPCSIIVYAQQTTPTGNFVPDDWILNGYNGGLGDIPAIIQGQEWFTTFTWSQYAPGPVTMVCNPAYMQVYLSQMQPGIPGTVTVGLKPEQTAALSVGLTSFQIYVEDVFGMQLVSLNIFAQVVAAPLKQQLGIQLQKNSVDVGTVGPYMLNFTGAGVGTVSNSGGVMTIDFPSYGGILAVGVTAPLASTGGLSPTLSIPVATSSVNGYLSSANWTTFNSKVTSVSASGALTSSGGTTPAITHNNSGVTASTYAYPSSVTVNAFGHVTAMTAGSAPPTLAGVNAWTNVNTFSTASYVDFSTAGVRVTVGAVYSAAQYSQKGLVSFSADGAAAYGGQVTAIALPGVNKAATYSFFPTFNYAPDPNPRLAANIRAGFTSTWGTEFLDICVGNNGSSNDGAVLCKTIAKFSNSGVAITGALSVSSTFSLPGTTSQYVRGDGSLATLPTGGSGTVTSVAAGNGMSFTTFSTTGSVAMGTPLTITASTTNGFSGSGHTHTITGFLPLTGGTLSGTLTGTTIQASTIKETSDRKYKTDIRAIEDGLYIMERLKPVRFYNKLTDAIEVGFIAQDMQALLHEVVGTDEHGDLAVSYQRIIAPMVQALQTINARLLALEAR